MLSLLFWTYHFGDCTVSCNCTQSLVAKHGKKSVRFAASINLVSKGQILCDCKVCVKIIIFLLIVSDKQRVSSYQMNKKAKKNEHKLVHIILSSL